MNRAESRATLRETKGGGRKGKIFLHTQKGETFAVGKISEFPKVK